MESIFFIIQGMESNSIEEENLRKLNALLKGLGAEAIITKHKGIDVSDYRCVNIYYDNAIVEQKRTRGAGRKVNSDASIAKWSQFCDLRAEGKTKDEIMEIMGISRATYYRYLKSY